MEQWLKHLIGRFWPAAAPHGAWLWVGAEARSAKIRGARAGGAPPPKSAPDDPASSLVTLATLTSTNTDLG